MNLLLILRFVSFGMHVTIQFCRALALTGMELDSFGGRDQSANCSRPFPG